MRFIVIGINDAAQQEALGFRNAELADVIASHRIFSGGVRHHELVASLLPASYEWIDIKVPLDAVFARYREHEQEEIVVFASGDPLFFGFANTILNRMPEAAMVTSVTIVRKAPSATCW